MRTTNAKHCWLGIVARADVGFQVPFAGRDGVRRAVRGIAVYLEILEVFQ
jgi:hypothetical protein